MSRESPTPPRWYVISLRPSDEHEALRCIAAQYASELIELSPWSIRSDNTIATRMALAEALRATRIVVTSPNAVRALRDLCAADARAASPSLPRPPQRAGQTWFAVGAGTAQALSDFGIAEVRWPERMDSEGLLALPGLQSFAAGESVGLLTAPGGRGVIAPSLSARGAQVIRADIYRREPAPLSRFMIARLSDARAPLLLALSSGEALQRVLDELPAQAAARLRQARVSAASERLAQLAREAGFADVGVAAGPGARELLAPLSEAASG
ncbi:uroporphyrinogen-III synthase [Lysobacter sp. K5869]|uniref:uroporphyrinogen-III synthase n=1 Tax=Lysobacter sp. K5869 TaxID=2820808 RepID=UPI001C0600B0|nr:uroporphyrinogen-III synthase [Lysobacter sp. K5869]QWP77337.1 uroporphyrinogen-III synthase [Lysobacter sp. K5869]